MKETIKETKKTVRNIILTSEEIEEIITKHLKINPNNCQIDWDISENIIDSMIITETKEV
jgi:hypothetical protein